MSIGKAAVALLEGRRGMSRAAFAAYVQRRMRSANRLRGLVCLCYLMALLGVLVLGGLWLVGGR